MADETEGFASKAGGGLKKKIGPLEVWQWGAATLGVLFAYLAYKNHAASSAGGPSSAPATNTSLPGSGAAPTDIGTTITGQLTNLTGQVGALQQQVAGLTTSNTGTPVTTSPTQGGISSDVQALYANSGLTADPAGAQFWQGRISAGDTNVKNEFAAANPTAFVTQQYATQLNRSPDQAGLSYWAGQVTTAGAQQETQAFTAAAKNEKK